MINLLQREVKGGGLDGLHKGVNSGSGHCTGGLIKQFIELIDSFRRHEALQHSIGIQNQRGSPATKDAVKEEEVVIRDVTAAQPGLHMPLLQRWSQGAQALPSGVLVSSA
jgi:hypothetical protein